MKSVYEVDHSVGLCWGCRRDMIRWSIGDGNAGVYERVGDVR